MQGYDEADSAGDPVSLDGLDQAHAEVRADSSIQFELPPAEQRPPQQQQREETRPAPDFPSGDTNPIVLPLFWIFVALAAAGLIYLIVARMAGWGNRERQGTAAPAEPEWRPEEAVARGLLGDADALAASGRFSEAAHLLLFRSIDEIDQRRPATIRKALTSRDIAALPAIPPAPASAFATIVRAVERSLFGGRTLDATDWQDCRAAFERFAFARDWA